MLSVIVLFLASLSLVLTVTAEPSLLDIVRTDPELSILASIIAKTGNGVANPDIDQRFDKNGGNQSFMLMAPTNEAFSRISKPVMDQLSVPLNYPLLLSLLRHHFIESDNMTSLISNLSPATTSKDVKTVTATSSEGYPIVFDIQQGTDYINNTYYTASFSAQTPIKASNGRLHKINRVLDPYASTFGVSPNNTNAATQTIIDNTPRQEGKTMTDLVNAEPELKIWKTTITTVLSAIMKRLGDRRGAEGGACKTPFPFAVIPVNSAFSLLPAKYIDTLSAPFNFALASHLLAWSLSVPTCANFDDIRAKIKQEGSFKIFSHRADLNLTVTEVEGVLRVNNARVLMANRCAGNGCIWMVDRLVDPTWNLF